MSRASRQSLRRISARQRSRQQSWLRRYLKALSTGVTAASLGAASLFNQSAYGDPDTWNGNASSNWSVAANWSGVVGNVKPISGDSLIFAASNASVGGYNLFDDYGTPGTLNINTITFNTGATQGYTINTNPLNPSSGFTLTTGLINNTGFTETINDGITLGNADTVTFNSTGGFILGGVISGAGSLATSGVGTLTLSGASNFSGGVTLGTSGDVLNINNAGASGTSALGTGVLTIATGANSTINNTSGAALTVATNNLVNLNADLTFTGTNNLSLGTGNVALGGNPGTRTITVNAGTLTMGPIGGGGNVPGIGLTVAGPGALTITNNGTNNIGGDLTVNPTSTFNMTRSTVLTGGGLQGSGVIQLGPNANAGQTLTISPTGSEIFSGTLSNTFVNGTNRAMSLTMTGTGTQTLNGPTTFTGPITMTQGTINLNSQLGTSAFGLNTGMTVGNTAVQKAILNISADVHTTGQIVIGTSAYPQSTPAAGAIYQTGGNFTAENFTGVNAFQLGGGTNGTNLTGYGYYKLSNGTLSNNEIGIGAGTTGSNTMNTTGVMDITGGTFMEHGWIAIARGGGITTPAQSVGVLNITGGTVICDDKYAGHISLGGGAVAVGNTWQGQLSITNSSILGAPFLGAYSLSISDSANVGSQGIANLNANSFVRVGSVTANNTTSATYLNFNGGTLIASASSGAFINANVTGVYINGNGATIDNNGTVITFNHALLAPTGNGISVPTISSGGSGYIGAPAVIVVRDPTDTTGVDASAVATVDPITGQVTGITITNPGSNYTVAPTFQLIGGGGTGATFGAIPFADNTTGPQSQGGIVFKGIGITTISGGTSTYNGATAINNGQVVLSGAATISNSSGITVGTTGAGATRANFVVTSSAPLTRNVALNNGTLDGTGNLTGGTVTVGDLSTNIVANGNNGALGAISAATAATYSNLTFNGAAQLNPVTSFANRATTMINTTNLTTGSGIVSVNPTNTLGYWDPGTYQLVGYTTVAGPSPNNGLDNITIGTILGLGGGRQTATLDKTTTPGLITLVVSGDNLTWTGATNTNWTTNQVGGGATFNWNLTNALTGTDFQAADAVIFPDALGAQTVNISDASVSAGAVIFNNNTTNSYTVNASNPAFGISGNGVLRLNGTGSVTLNTPNTFAGGVVINATGTLVLGNDTALGAGPLTMLVAGETIKNTTGHTVILGNTSILLRGFTLATGSGDLNFGSGTITTNASPTINVTDATSTVTINSAIGGGNFGITKSGLGKLVLGGANTIYGAIAVQNGTLELTGSYTAGGATVLAGTVASQNGILKVNGGTLNANNTGLFTRGFGPGSANGAAGDIRLTNNGTINSLTEIQLAATSAVATPTYGAISMDSGTIISGGQIRIANGAGGLGVFNQSGGTVTIQNGKLEMAQTVGNSSAPTTAILNLSGNAIFNATAFFGGDGAIGGAILCESAATSVGILNLGGTSQFNVSATSSTFNISSVAGGVGTINFNGGTLTVPAIARGGTGNINFNGGTLRANNTSAAFMNNGFTATVYGGGVTIDNGGFPITITQQINTASGSSGLTPNGYTFAGSGYIDTPVIAISGGGGAGATAVPVMTLDANGTYHISGITITSPGTGYSSAPTFTVSGGGIGSTQGTSVITVSNLGQALAANTSGQITIAGTGTTTLTPGGASSYNGGTNLTQGTLVLGNNNAIGVGALTISGGTLDVGQAVTLPNTVTENWNANVVYGGSNTLNTGTGTVTMNATRTVTTNGTGNLTVGGAIVASPAGSGIGLIKSGPTRLLLSGTSTYDGPTTVNQGKLVLSGAGSINGSSGVTINNGTTFIQDSSTAMQATTPVHIVSGGVDGNSGGAIGVIGTGQIGILNVDNGASNTIANGDGGSLSLSIGALNFSGAGTMATMNLTASDANKISVGTPIATVVTNSITTGAGTVLVNASNPTGWASDTYKLVSYTGTDPFSHFTKGTISGLSSRATSTLVEGSGYIGLQISTVSPIWTGALNSNWTTAALASPKNWKLPSNAITDFLPLDTVIFDNTANTGSNPNAFSVNIIDNVNPSKVTFNNDLAHPYTISATGAVGILGTGSVLLNGPGAVTMSASSSGYSGGTTLISGTLNINALGTGTPTTSSIGTGALTITGGTVDSSDGGGTLSTNNAQIWNGDFTYAVNANTLNFGNGAVTISGATGTTRTVTIGNNAAISVGPMNGVAGALPNLTLVSSNGGGSLSVNTPGTTSNIGVLTVPAGMTFNIGAGDFHTTGLFGATTATIQNNSNTSRQLFVNYANTSVPDVFDGVLTDGAGTGQLAFNKSGAGTLQITGTTNSLTGAVNVSGGQLLLTGSIIPSGATTNVGGPSVLVGSGTNNPILNIQGGAMTVSQTANTAAGVPSIQVGNGTVGVLKMTAGTTPGSSSLTTYNELWLATADGNYGAFDMADGTAMIQGVLALGRGGGRGVLNMSNGTLTLQGSSNSGGIAGSGLPPSFGLSVGNTGGSASVTHGTANFSGGTTTVSTNIAVGDGSNGVMNVTGGTVTVNGSSTAGQSGVFLAAHAGATGTLNLVSGTLSTPSVNAGSITDATVPTTDGGTAILNFNGGTLQATASGTFIGTVNSPATLTATVYKKGAVIDDNFQSITISQPLVAATGSGVSGAGLTVTNTGTPYASAPTVTISGGGGSGATAIVNLNSDGTINSANPLTITSPGTGYTSNPTFTLNGGGLNNTSSIAVTNPAITNSFLADNVGGGLTKLGAGNLFLSSVNTYNGPTKVTAGTLHLGVNNAIGSASTLNMAGGNFNAESFTDQLGTLRVTANNSAIDISGTGNLQFANSSLTHWRYSTNAAPVIVNVTGTSGVGSDFDANEIVFPSSTSLNANQLSQIQFNSTPGTYGALRLIGNTNPLNPYIGMYELVSTNTLPTGILTLGDINQDGTVNVRDISALMSALVNTKGYENGTAVYGGTSTPIRTTGGIFNDSQLLYLADVNFDDHVDNQDIQSLISYIASGLTLPPSPAPAPGSIPGSSAVTAVPEPGSIVLFVLGSIPGVWVMRKRFGRRGAEVEKSEV